MQLIEVLILVTILYASWRIGQPIIARKEMRKKMKHLRNPTKKQSILISSRKLNPNNWLVERDTPEKLVIVSRSGKQKRPIYKEV